MGVVLGYGVPRSDRRIPARRLAGRARREAVALDDVLINRSSVRRAGLAAVTAVALIGGFGTTATAAVPKANTPSQIVERLTPDIAAETSNASGLIQISPEAGRLKVSADSPEAPEGGHVSAGVDFSIDYAKTSTARPDGSVEFTTGQPFTSGLVQPTGAGVRVLTVISDPQATSAFSYTFDVPQGTTLERSATGYHLKSETVLYGSLRLPWAVDAEGIQLPTWYTWSGTTLTQHVDHSAANIEYPVVADPAWQYSYFYTLNKTPIQAREMLKGCFNCLFPVSGAPRAFPTVGQILPLTVGPANFECRFKSEFSSATYFGFQFDATENHVDGAGSNIIFQFQPDTYLPGLNATGFLTVDAYIVNDSWWLNNDVYRAAALANWQKFADNVNITSLPQA